MPFFDELEVADVLFTADAGGDLKIAFAGVAVVVVDDEIEEEAGLGALRCELQIASRDGADIRCGMGGFIA